MEENLLNNKKTIILASATVLIIILLIVLSVVKKTTDTSAKKLEDEHIFFSIQNLLSEEGEYENYMSSSFTTTEVYYKTFNLIDVYFIKGFLVLDDNYEGIEYYLLRIKGIGYELTKLDDNTNIKDYADHYMETPETLSSTKIMPASSYDEKAKLLYYITLFKNYLEYDNDKAYDLLTDTMKNKYSSQNDFNNKSETINNQIPTKIETYTLNDKKYTINTNDNKTIYIYENSLMDFKIEY